MTLPNTPSMVSLTSNSSMTAPNLANKVSRKALSE
jgi:hypothetical protein